MADKIIDSFNIYIDTDRGDVNPSASGSEADINMSSMKIDIAKGEFFRLSLINFSMYKSYANVNSTNDKFLIKTTADNAGSIISIPNKNYSTVFKLMKEFADSLKTPLLAYATNATQVEVILTSPTDDDTLDGDTDNKFDFKLVFKNGSNVAVSHGISGLKLQTFETINGQMSDAYALIGSKKIHGSINTSQTLNSYIIDEDTVDSEISFKGFYPAQRSTEPFVYLRCNLGNASRNMETSSLSAAIVNRGNVSSVHSSNIFAKMPVAAEFIHYDSQHGNEYFMNLHNMRHLTNLKFYLTNTHGVPLHKLSDHVEHGENGNLSFSMVLKVDIVQKNAPNENHTQPINRGIDIKGSNQLYTIGGLGKF